MAIQQVLNRYPEAVDERSWSTLDQVFTDDARCDLRAVGLGTTRGRDQLVALFDRIDHPVAHHLVNPVIELGDGVAHVRSKWLVVLEDRSTLSGNYDDEFVETNRGWRIRTRVVTSRQDASRRPVPGYDHHNRDGSPG